LEDLSVHLLALVLFLLQGCLRVDCISVFRTICLQHSLDGVSFVISQSDSVLQQLLFSSTYFGFQCGNRRAETYMLSTYWLYIGWLI
jgi:hypothetical protein